MYPASTHKHWGGIPLTTRCPLAAAPSSQQTPEIGVRSVGKFFQQGGDRWYLKGLTYGPFAPNVAGVPLPERPQVLADFARLRDLGANAIRLYHVPPVQVLDDAIRRGLRVMLDVPWEKHRCFFEDRADRSDALRRVRTAARDLGNHPAVFAVSVANEIPHDIVRFYGARRVERFIDDLLAAAKDEAPDCLVTYTNYPSTEFLSPTRLDFYCANVYLEDDAALGRYLDRLQHVAGPLPLVLGECGADALRHGTAGQAESVGRQVRQVSRRGLAGGFVFAYTDDWFTGGHPVDGWAFGVTDRGRVEKPAAATLRAAWAEAPAAEAASLPRVSVVVCSYNGAATLTECLDSLTRLRYPDFELILVDDGSTDDTGAIADRFPEVRYLRQANLGLSAARNAGLAAATGRVVAYTDSDCVADESWLVYLVQAMQDQGVDAVGGPNVPPPSGNWVAKCVAASPGGPSHVMLDDRRAEHVPGCNMAFDRDTLRALGGFDPQFRQAGDDVDICWRFIDAGMTIGYAAAALVWHHRRSTVGAYIGQQKGYGRSEAMLHFKHPHRFTALGASRWHGIIYGEGAVGLPTTAPSVFHGRFGTGLFQIVYRKNRYSSWAYCTLLEWHALAALVLLLSVAWPPLALAAAGMWCLTLGAAIAWAVTAPLPPNAPLWCRPLVWALHLAQPVVRSWQRYRCRLANKRVPRSAVAVREATAEAGPAGEPRPKVVSWSDQDLDWNSRAGRGREHLLAALVGKAQADGWRGDFQAEWHAHDVELWPDPWHTAFLRTATEELGGHSRFTRVRCSLRPTRFVRVAASVGVLCLGAGLAGGEWWVILPPVTLLAAALARMAVSRRRCRRAVTRLVWDAGRSAGLEPVSAEPTGDAERVSREEDKPCRRSPNRGGEDHLGCLPAGSRPAFSLVELLVVIGIIALLVGILLPSLGRARESARRTACQSNLRSLGQAMFIYANTYKDRLPNGNSAFKYSDYDGANRMMTDFCTEYVKEPRVFWCPSDRDPPPTRILTADPLLPDSARTSYEFYFLFWPPELGPVLTRLKGLAPLAWDLDGAEPTSPLQNHGNKGGNVVFADGHVEWQDAREWDGPSWPNPAARFYPP
jgi:prepilin-type processing-associated H-X9-DG protein